jgi:oligopeptide/dipeptide ABC transporter ATP-binding protein
VTTQAQIMQLLKDLTERRQMSLLVITHDIALAVSTVDEVIVMYAGRIVEHASSEALVREPHMPYTRALIASVPGMEGRRALPKAISGSPPDPRQLGVACPFAPRCEVSVARCTEETPPLVTVAAHHESACWHDVDLGSAP